MLAAVATAALNDTSSARTPESLLTVISVDLENVSLESALAAIAAKGDFDLSYNRSRLPVGEKVTVRMEEVSALKALSYVLEETDAELAVTSDGQLAVVPSAAAGDRRTKIPATLSGFVRDRSDGEHLPYASVVVGDQQMGTLTNVDGYYALPGLPAGTWVITVSSIGYAAYRDTLHLAAGQELRRDIELTRESLELEAVVVKTEADRVENELSPQSSVVVLPMKSLRKMPAMGEPDLLRSLQLLPGVQSASDFSSGLYVRGGGPDQTGILLDQVRLYNPAHAFGFFSTFNPDAIKDVTFYKGAYPARYGGNLGAILDVQNRDGNRRRFSNSGGVSLISSRYMSEGPLGQGSWMVAGRRTYIDPVLRAVGRSADGLDLGYWFYDLNAKINTQLTPDDNLMISAYGGEDHLDISLSDSTDADNNTLSFGNEWGNRALTGRWTHLFSPALFGRAILLYSKYHSDIIIDFFGTPVEIRNKVRDVTFKGDFDWFASPEHTLRAGVDLTRFRFDYGVRFDEYEEDQVVRPYLLSAYIQDDWQVTPLTEALVGLRGTFYEEGRRLSLNPRLSLSRVLHDGWRLKLAGGSYQQLLQLVSTEGFESGNLWIPLDETVDPGRSYQVVSGLEWDPSVTWRVTVESYYTGLTNLVVLDEDQEENAEEVTSEDIFKTGGKGYATGLEVFAERRRGRLTGWLGYTLGWTRRRFPEIDEGRSFPPKYDRRHDLSLTARYGSGPWTWTANFVYGTGQAFTPAAARYTLRDPASGRPVDRFLAASRNSARLLPYHRLDAGVRRRSRLFGAEVEWYLQVFNLYSRRNEWFIQYDPGNPDREASVVKMLPILPTFGFDFRF